MRNSILAVLPSSSLRRLGARQPRPRHQDAIAALPLDHRLDGAELVDTALDDLNRLLDGLAYAFGDGGLRHRQAGQAAAGITYLQASLTAGAEQTSQRLRQLA